MGSENEDGWVAMLDVIVALVFFCLVIAIIFLLVMPKSGSSGGR